MSEEPRDPNNDGDRFFNDTAFWRGDLTELWVFLALLVFNMAVVTLVLEFGEFVGIFAWLGMVGALFVSWLVTIFILIPHTAITQKDWIRKHGGEVK